MSDLPAYPDRNRSPASGFRVTKARQRIRELRETPHYLIGLQAGAKIGEQQWEAESKMTVWIVTEVLLALLPDEDESYST